MRHEMTYHTCDRCGNKLRKRNFFDKIFRLVRCYNLQYRDIIREEQTRHTVTDDGKEEIEIFVSDGIRQLGIELCPKCARAFRRFMRCK